MLRPPVEPEQVSIRTRKQEFVRRELWTSAIDLFDEAGFDDTTVEQIAHRAEVSTRTFFRYFPSKEDVMAVTVRDYGAALIAALNVQPLQANSFEAARAVVKQVTRLAVESPSTAKVLRISEKSRAARSAQLLELPFIEDDLARAFSLRQPSGDQDALRYALLANLTLSTTTTCITSWRQAQDREIEELVDQAFALLVSICCPQSAKTPANVDQGASTQ